MEKHLNMGINDVIAEFPEVGNLLDSYGIGCITCKTGTCLLKDIVKIHYLPKDDEIEVMEGIKEIIASGGKAPSSIKRVRTNSSISYAPPIKRLVEEHDRIKRLLALIPYVCKELEVTGVVDKKLLGKIVHYIRNYADKFHHAKEEDILFKYTDETQEIIKTMYEDHILGRSYVKSVVEGVEEENIGKITTNLKSYMELLFEHIKKEDEILYPWFERGMTTEQLKEFENLSNEAEKTFDEDFTLEFEGFLVRYELRFKKLM
jgi:hemerythrin-like domain-containing protein